MITTPRLSYTRKHATVATVETAGVDRVAGLFSMNGCPVRSADTSQIRVLTSDFVPDPSLFALVITLDPDNDWDADTNYHHVLTCQFDTGSMAVFYHDDGASASFNLALSDGSTTIYAGISGLTWSAGQQLTVLVYGDKNGTGKIGIAVSVNASAITALTTANWTNGVPSGVTGNYLYVGSNANTTAANYSEAVISYLAAFQHVPVASEADYFVDLARMPSLGELPVATGSIEPCALWQGHRREYETGLVLDLNTTLDDPEGIHVRPPLAGMGDVPVSMRATQTPNRDGSVVSEVLMDDRYINVLLELDGADWAGVNALRQTLARATNPRNMGAREAIGLLTYCPYDGSPAYTIEAIRERLVMADPLLDIRERPTLNLRCPSPALQREPVNIDLVQPVPGGTDIPSAIPTPIYAGERFTITNGEEGDLPVSPLVRIYGPVVNPFIGNVTTGRRFSLVLNVPSGDVVTIDMKARTATLSDGTNVMGNRTAFSQMWELVPGENSIEAGYFSSTSVPVTFEVEHRRQVAGV